jgi:hypothetical protein
MTTAQHLAVIELLRTRNFPADSGPSEAGRSGPGYHLAELCHGSDPWDDDGSGRPQDHEQCEAECAALELVLTARFGEPQHVGLWSVLVRGGEGEHLPEPWRELSAVCRSVLLWRTGGRLLVLGVAERDGEQPVRLLAAVTETDPP